MKAKSWLGCLIAASGLFLAGAVTSAASATESSPNKAQITMLYIDKPIHLYAGLGTVLNFGQTVRSAAEARQTQSRAIDEDELRSYRMLLAQSDDNPEKVLAHGEQDLGRRLARRAY